MAKDEPRVNIDYSGEFYVYLVVGAVLVRTNIAPFH